MKIQDVTTFILLFGLVVFYGFAGFTDKMDTYNIWDHVYYVWDKVNYVLFSLTIIKVRYINTKHFELLLPVFIVRIFAEVIVDYFDILPQMLISKVYNILSFLWMVIIIAQIMPKRKKPFTLFLFKRK